MIGHLINWLLASEREAIDARQAQRTALMSALTDGVEALPEAMEVLLPQVEQWVYENLSDRSAAAFAHAQTVGRELPNGNFGFAGPVDVSVDDRKPVRSWFIVEMTDEAKVVYGDIVDVLPPMLNLTDSATS